MSDLWSDEGGPEEHFGMPVDLDEAYWQCDCGPETYNPNENTHCFACGKEKGVKMTPPKPAPKIEADKELQELIRDACSIVPVPKSEYRRRLLAWRDRQIGAELELLMRIRSLTPGYEEFTEHVKDRLSQLGAKDE